MSLVQDIQKKFEQDQFEFSKHAVDQSIKRNIEVQEIRQAIISGKVIEDYPKDKYGSSCLILGFTLAHRPLHIQCSHPLRPLIKIITLYEPNLDQWSDFSTRKTT